MAKVKYQRKHSEKKKTKKTKSFKRSKKYFDATELEAMQKSYGKALTFGDYKKYVLTAVIFTAGFATLLFHNLIITVITGFFGAVYGFKVIMHYSITRSYQMNSLYERQKFINSLTQILTDDQKITLGAIELANSRTKGELNEDINILQARIEGAHRSQIQHAFEALRQKYANDILFGQYLEQIETALTAGRASDIETIKQQKTYHNDTVKNTEEFLKIKEGHYAGIKLITGIIATLIVMVMFSFGFHVYHEALTRTIVGNIFGGVFYAILLFLMHSFYKIYFDDEVMSVGKYVPKTTAEATENTENNETIKNNKNTENPGKNEIKAVKTNPLAKQLKTPILAFLGQANQEKLLEMNNSEAMILNWACKKFLVVLTLLIATLLTKVITGINFALLGGLALTLFYYFLSMNRINSMYLQYVFERQLKFAKFARLVIPHLKSKGSSNLHSILEKVLHRMENAEDKLLLMRLMEDMTNKPKDATPFTDYANQMSKTDKAVLFMNTIYDIKQGSADLSIIEEMDQLMSQDLMASINAIIKYKENKFSLFSTKLTMSIIIFFLGVVITFLIHEVQNAGLLEVL